MPPTIVRNATVLVSGGIDSTACVQFLKKQGACPRGIFIDHGQAAAQKEARAIAALAPHLGIEVDTFHLSRASKLGTGELVGRNAMLIFAALFLTSDRPGLLGVGLHAGTPYYDSSETFVTQVSRLVSELTDGRVAIVAPFISWSKRDVFDYFTKEALPIELTYSCEAGTDPEC